MADPVDSSTLVLRLLVGLTSFVAGIMVIFFSWLAFAVISLENQMARIETNVAGLLSARTAQAAANTAQVVSDADETNTRIAALEAKPAAGPVYIKQPPTKRITLVSHSRITVLPKHWLPDHPIK